MIAVFIACVAAFQERIAFQPQGPPYPLVEGAERVEYSAEDGQRLFAYLVGPASSEDSLLIAFHGNADLAALQLDWALEVVRRTGTRVMLAEYRGYGGLRGKPTYQGSQLDAEAAHTYATAALGISPEKIAFFGHSLGTAIAAELATLHNPCALVLQSPFTSARDMATAVVGHRPSSLGWRLFSRIHFDTLERVKQLDAPVSVAHGGQDRLIDPRMGQTIFECAKRKGEWLLVPNASHNDVAIRGGEAYWSWMTRSLASPRHASLNNARTGS